MLKDDRVQNMERHLKRIIDDPDGRKLLAEHLDVHFADPNEKDRPLVAILIPSNRHLKQEAENSIRQLVAYSRQQGIGAHQPMVMGHSVIHWTRNELVQRLYNEKIPFTHVLFIDDDMEVQEDSLVRMLSHKKDIVAALSTRRMDPPIPTLRNFNEKTGDFTQKLQWSGQGGLIEVDAAGTGMMLISKKALDRLSDFYIRGEYERKMGFVFPHELVVKRIDSFNKNPKNKNNGFWFQFLPALNGNGEYGEDLSFCLKAKLCGIQVYCDTSATPKHHGDYGYSIADYFGYKHELIAEAKAKGEYTDGTEEVKSIGSELEGVI